MQKVLALPQAVVRFWKFTPIQQFKLLFSGKSAQIEEWSRTGQCLFTWLRMPKDLLVGEFQRSIDDRFRVGIPTELLEPLQLKEGQAMLVKERPGCLSLWNADLWRQKMDAGMAVVQGKIKAGRLEGRLNEVQQLGRLLSTRHREVKVSERGRLLVPEGFREFLRVETGEEAMVVGAAVCVEIWRPASWIRYLNRRMARFGKLFDGLVE